MSDEGAVGRKSEEGGVELLILRHPPVNALSRAVLDELDTQIQRIEQDPTARALLLTGDGAFFSAGADLKEMASLDLATAPSVVRRGQALFQRISTLRVPVIAAINGLALGGGLELALACDLRVAGESAKLGSPEVNYGLLPAYGGTQRLTRLIGEARAKELIFTGAMIPATEALKLGLVNKVVPSGQELRAGRDLAHTIAERAPKAVQAAKRAINEGRDLPLLQGIALEAELFARAVLPSPDLAEGIAAFNEHRPPKFRGV